MAPTNGMMKLEVLEARIAAAVQQLNEFNERCRALSEKNNKMADDLADLQESNKDLSQQIALLKAEKARAPRRSVDDKKILHRIDRMLEKFGELQI